MSKETNLSQFGFTFPSKKNDPDQKKFSILISAKENDLVKLLSHFQDVKSSSGDDSEYDPSVLLAVTLSSNKDGDKYFWKTSIIGLEKEVSISLEDAIKEFDFLGHI